MAKSKRPFVEFPLGSPPTLEMFHVPESGTVTVRFLGNAIGCFIHRNGDTNIPCAGAGECRTEVHKHKGVWKGYAPADRWRPDPYGDWVPVVLEITAMLGQKLGSKALRGQMWKLYRSPNRYGHKEGDGHQVDLLSPSDLPLYFDPRPIVMRVYNTQFISFDEVNPVPARQIVETSKGAPPPDEHVATPQATVATRAQILAALKADGYREPTDPTKGGKPS